MRFQEWEEEGKVYRYISELSFLQRLAILILGRLCCVFEKEVE